MVPYPRSPLYWRLVAAELFIVEHSIVVVPERLEDVDPPRVSREAELGAVRRGVLHEPVRGRVWRRGGRGAADDGGGHRGHEDELCSHVATDELAIGEISVEMHLRFILHCQLKRNSIPTRGLALKEV